MKFPNWNLGYSGMTNVMRVHLAPDKLVEFPVWRRFDYYRCNWSLEMRRVSWSLEMRRRELLSAMLRDELVRGIDPWNEERIGLLGRCVFCLMP